MEVAVDKAITAIALMTYNFMYLPFFVRLTSYQYIFDMQLLSRFEETVRACPRMPQSPTRKAMNCYFSKQPCRFLEYFRLSLHAQNSFGMDIVDDESIHHVEATWPRPAS